MRRARCWPSTAATRHSDMQDVILRLEGIGKQFPGVRALDNISLELLAGEVHVLLGENGAGKSTLMKILSGEYAPDGGRIVVRGKAEAAHDPKRASSLGIGLVHQELSLIPALSVAENIFLGRMPRGTFGRIDWWRAYKDAETALSELGVAIDPRREVR